LAIQAHLKNEFQIALNLYSEIITNDNNNFHARHLLGILLIQNGHIEAGNLLVKEAIELNNNSYSEAEYNLSILNSSIESKYQQELDHALTLGDYQFINKNTTDDWRHMRMIDFAHFFKDVGINWLTIGDHYGHDAIRLASLGITSVVASSLNDGYLNQAKNFGLIKDYLAINAEHIKLESNSFDYVLCKEA
jgi:tetratricopeptide (TPR) repeat protein